MADVKTMWAHYKKPTPLKWRKIGDYILLLTAFIDGSLPKWPIPDEYKIWIAAGVSFIGITLKFWTNTKKEENA